MKPLGKSSANNSTNGAQTENGNGGSGKSLLSKVVSFRNKKDRNSVVMDDNTNTKEKESSHSKRNSFINSSKKNSRNSIVVDEEHPETFDEKLGKSVKDLRDLREELEKTKLEKSKVETRNQDLIKEIEKLKSDHPAKSRDVQTSELDQQLRDELKQKDEKIQQLESDLNISKQEIGKLSDISKSENLEFEKVKVELQDQKSLVENFTKELSVCKQEFEKVKKDAQEQTQQSVESETEKSRVASEVSKHEINHLKSELDQRDSTIQQLKSDLTASKNENEKLSEFENIKLALTSSQQETENLKAKVVDQSSLIEKLQKESQQRSDENERLVKTLNLVKEEVSKVKNDNENQINQIQIANNLNSDLKSQVEDLTKQVEDAKKDTEVARKTAENANLEGSVDKSVQDQLENFENENLSMKSQIEKLNDELAQRDSILKSTTSEIQTVSEQRNEVLREIDLIKSELQSVQESVRNQDDLENQNADLRLQLETKENTIQQQTINLLDMIPKDQFGSLQKALEQTKSELDSTINELQFTKSELELKCQILSSTDISSLEELKSQLSNVKAQLKANDWEKKRSERSIFELKSQVDVLSQNKDQCQQLGLENVKLRQQLEQMKTQVRNMEKLMQDNERLRFDNDKLLESSRKTHELIELKNKESSSAPSPTSPKSSSKSLPKTNGVVDSKSNGIGLAKLEPSLLASSPTNTISNKSKRNNVVQSNGITSTPQANFESSETNNSINQPIPRPKKDNGNGEWVTVKKRSTKARNSTVID
ncbi:3403_t:CDS:2 [Funneliformis geosporum]|uniref:10669_t:CDS:1 n=1 Tax=Funneliformis geosporum TaxID=1117311 RepID=A0A9W4ST71_9GLOM|nr:3403_t:CDS:2 [Funneliformis geosporum]CAI2178275.1 10669_t:CDS:2 [Funneliformis geosporum]